MVNRALGDAPEDADLLVAKAETLSAGGRHREALNCLLAARQHGRHGAAFCASLGIAHSSVGEYEDAIASVRRAVSEEPGVMRWRQLLGTFLQAAGRPAEAVLQFEAVIQSEPQNTDAVIELARSYLMLDDASNSEPHARRAVEIDPQRVDGWALLGIAALLQHRPADALQQFARAQALAPGVTSRELLDQFVIALSDLGHTRECIELLERDLPANPSWNAHLAYAAALLAENRQLDGWAQFEFRWLTGPLAENRPDYGKPVWMGQDLRGKTIYVRAEQGFGDVFQMLRYLPLLKDRGAKVLLQPIEAFVSMYRQLEGVDAIGDPGAPLPPFDYWTNLMSLPRAFGTTEATTPRNIPYLTADPELIARWRPVVPHDGKLNVGIVWSGNPKQRYNARRSISFEKLEPILRVRGARFFSVQKGPASDEALHAPPGIDVVALGPELSSFGDTAAVLSQLDLLISTCTSVPHLAGALGRPVWLLLSEPADYRWLKNREDTPWYPSMRLYRQNNAGDWDDVIRRVQIDLQALADLKEAGATEREIADAAVPGRGAYVAKAEEADVPRIPATVACVSHTRAGMIQYLPERGIEGRSIHWYGEYLQPLLEYLHRLLRPGETMLEAGAGFGMQSVLLGKALGPHGHLILYEFDPSIRQLLSQNLAANGVTNVTLPTGTLRLVAPSESEEHGPAAIIGTREPGENSIDELEFDRLDWLKTNPGVDSLGLLRGAGETLWRLRPRMLLAAGDEDDLRSIAEFSRTFGYRGWRVDTPYFSEANFNCRTDDIFQGLIHKAVLAIPEEVEVSLTHWPVAEL